MNEELRRRCRLQVHLEMLEKPFHLKFEIQFEVLLTVDFSKKSEHRHKPRVRWSKNLAVLARLDYLCDERHHRNHSPVLVSLEEQLLQIKIALQHRLVLCNGEVPEPGAQVFKQRSFRSTRLDLVASQQDAGIAIRRLQNLLVELSDGELVEQAKIQRMEIPLEAHALHDEISGKPREVFLWNEISDGLSLLRQVLRRKIVAQKGNLINKSVAWRECVTVLRSLEQCVDVERREDRREGLRRGWGG
mmetsp:Transcript_25113/g.82351  ORF Transcript_25113/g.82351 Transcript_25113/m.82351 type:complete len:246 (-) Transcript_25113:3065-3802(-)